MVPDTPDDPFARLKSIREIADSIGKLFWCPGVAELHGGKTAASREEVNVGIDEARDEHTSRY